MPPATSRYGSQVLPGGPFSHLQQQAHLSQHTSQHQPPGSAGLPPPSFPSFNAQHGFGQANNNANISAFASSANTNALPGGFGTGSGLNSREAMARFNHGAEIQREQQQRDAASRSSGGVPTSKHHMKGRIRDVWRHNLDQEMQVLRALVEKYTYISMVKSHISTRAY